MKKNNLFLIFAIFSVLLIGLVSANTGCCSETDSGAFCISAEKSNCIGDFAEGVTCDKATFKEGACISGCCIDYENGQCSSYSKKVTCENQGLRWEEGPLCKDVKAISPNPCVEGGCIVKNRCYFEEELACETRAKEEGVDKEFNKEITANACQAYHLDLEFGACVKESGFCTKTTRKDCTDKFIAGKLCSDDSLKVLGVSCEAKKNKLCIPGSSDIYYEDSCNNLEGIAEDCEEGVSTCVVEGGKYKCKSTSCGDLKNGESICVYEGAAGSGNNLIGSNHWIKSCVNGVLETTSCGDGRSAVCQEVITSNTDFKRAMCIPNIVEECFGITSVYNEKLSSEIKTYKDKGRFGSDQSGVSGKELREDAENDAIKTKTNEIMAEMSKACSENNLCMPKIGSVSTEADNYFNYGACMPKDSRGADFCDLATQTCTVFFRKRLDGLLYCVANCDCLKPSSFVEMNKVCSMAGDCGMKINYAGDDGSEGILYSPTDEIRPKTFDKDTIDTYPAIVAPEGLHENRKCPGDEGIDFEGQRYCFKDDGNRITQANFKINLKVFIVIDAIKQIKESLNEMKNPRTTSLPYQFPKGLSLEMFGGEDYSQETLNELMKKHQEENPSFNIEEFIARNANSQTNSWKYIKALQTNWWDRNIVHMFSGGIKRVDITYKCGPWEPALNGDNCAKCKDGDLECTEYRCRSLGAACILINKDTESPFCVSEEDDGQAPNIKNISYNGKSEENPIKIDLTKDSCLEESENVKFNISLDEPARCRYSDISYSTYESMPKNYPENNNLWNDKFSFNIETQSLAEVMEEYEYNKKVDFNLTVRCSDKNGHFSKELLMNYCVISRPDEYPPVVKEYDPVNKKAYEYNPKGINLTVYLDENASCKWDANQVKYEDMANEATYIEDEVTQSGYPHYIKSTSSTIGENRIFIKCRDNLGNENDLTYEYTVKRDISEDQYVKDYGLEITSIKMTKNDVEYISGSNIIVGKISPSIDLKIKTARGTSNGISTCKYGFLKDDLNAYFPEQESKVHQQTFDVLTSRDYTIFVECEDDASSIAENISFKFNIDGTFPKIVFNTTENNKIEFTTDEESQCYYSFKDCNFDLDAGESFGESDFTKTHSSDLNPTVAYYIKCMDKYGNDGCSGQIGEGYSEPKATRVYYEAGKLKINTDREAKCYFDFASCDFKLEDNENKMSSEFTKKHSLDWNPATVYYIKCEDKWETQNDGCLVKVRPNSFE